MGQEHSAIVSDDTPPETLHERSLAAVAEHIKSGKARRIVVMTGAGISTAAGIPDFRSPETGLYANLAKLNLPRPEAVFDLPFFRTNPKPFYVLAKDLYPGNFHPTVSHVFISLLAKKGLLHQLFTQNIDCLERAAGIPSELIVEAHGSFASQRCIECRTPYPDDLMREHVSRAEVPRCVRGPTECDGFVKPDIVFFHEALPTLFYDRKDLVDHADLALVMGTSLQVHPFAGLPEYVREGVPRVLFNMERVGSLGSLADDVLELGDCDAGVRKLADELGWRDELEAEWRELVGEEEAQKQLSGMRKRAEVLQDEVSRLADEVDEVLHLTEREAANEVGSATETTRDARRSSDAEAGGGLRPNNPVATAETSQEKAQEEDRKEAKETRQATADIDTAEVARAPIGAVSDPDQQDNTAADILSGKQDSAGITAEAKHGEGTAGI
ncbi:DHS-like NAD/FAD-binding domain-containing protein [Podospora aff. communis PSN243]|uniref:DHS-like NAD/FAD-binding domain-containing protein n=1 Tax=Podospora aff. communis PSN243 TaxID=3040156 RepID=A0AAV9GJB1_9PEZI|nr:DHS-like NAD/FAD-binding domain-containing protein [Podospora aff. communis PSN243]